MGVLLFSPLSSALDASAAYEQPSSVMDGAGGRTSSVGHRNISVVAQPSPPGMSFGSGYRNYAGFLHDIAALGHLLPDYTVTLLFSGTGTGIVTSTPAGIQCNTDCSAVFNSYNPVLLSAGFSDPMIFTGWSGGCSGTGICTLNLTGDVSVTATFENLGHSVWIPGGTPGTGYYSTLQAAYDGAPSGSEILAWDYIYVENLECAMGKIVTIKGGFDTGYGSQVGITTLDGTLTIGRGAVTVERLLIK